MRTHWLFAILACGLLLLTLAACEDPSTVGAELVSGSGGDPVAVEDTLVFEQETIRSETGNAPQVLAGVADDPLLGTITAKGYADFGNPENASSDFRDNPVSAVFLELVSDTTYGDEESSVTFRLRDMPDDWEAAGVTADTSLEAGSVVTEFSFSPSDSLVSVELPSSWVQENEEALQDTAFADRFHGFELEPSSGNAVLSLAFQSVRLRAVGEAESDTVNFNGSKNLTTIRRSGEVNLPPDRFVVQDGTGLAVHLTPDFSEIPSDASLNRATLRLRVDEETLEQTSDFVRPRLETLRLYGLPENGGDPVALFDLERNEDGEFASNASNEEFLRRLMQEEVLGTSEFESFRLAPVPRQQPQDPFSSGLLINTLSTVLLYGPGAPSECGSANGEACFPRLQLVYTPVEN